MEIFGDTSIYQISSDGGDVDHVKFGETFEEFQNEVRRLQGIEQRLMEAKSKLEKEKEPTARFLVMEYDYYLTGVRK